MGIVYLNGEYCPAEEAKISPQDRGFLFGDGVYEAIPFYSGKGFGFAQHWQRLQNGLGFLRIHFPVTQEDFAKICQLLLEKNDFCQVERTMIYLQITRGSYPKRNHMFPSEPVSPTVYVFCQEIQYPTMERWVQGFSASLQPDRRWGRVDIKTVNLLPNVLAYQDAKDQGADEAILHKDGVALEGAHANFWVVLDDEKDTIVTHPTTEQILPGITRAILLEEALAAGFVVEERPITLEELRGNVKEAFFTSTTSEIKPAVIIDGRPLGTGRAGDVTQRLLDVFTSRVQRDTAA